MSGKKSLIALLLALTLLASGCAAPLTPASITPEPAAEGPAEESAPAESAEPEAEAAETPEPEETAPAEPEKELPPLPDIDIYGWEFLYASPKQGVSRYHPHVRNTYGVYMDERASRPTVAFLDAAREAGYRVYIQAGYRNFEYHYYWYMKAINEYGSAYEACKHVFAPGCSEHSTGLAFDITDEIDYSANYYEMHDPTVADTEAYQWMAEHCAEYGFIVRYPEGKEEYYGMACQPGHFRYVGVEAAKYIMENDLCLEEFMALYGRIVP